VRGVCNSDMKGKGLRIGEMDKGEFITISRKRDRSVLGKPSGEETLSKNSCVSCGKIDRVFSTNQLRKPADMRRCTECVEKTEWSCVTCDTTFSPERVIYSIHKKCRKCVSLSQALVFQLPAVGEEEKSSEPVQGTRLTLLEGALANLLRSTKSLLEEHTKFTGDQNELSSSLTELKDEVEAHERRSASVHDLFALRLHHVEKQKIPGLEDRLETLEEAAKPKTIDIKLKDHVESVTGSADEIAVWKELNEMIGMAEIKEHMLLYMSMVKKRNKLIQIVAKLNSSVVDKEILKEHNFDYEKIAALRLGDWNPELHDIFPMWFRDRALVEVQAKNVEGEEADAVISSLAQRTQKTIQDALKARELLPRIRKALDEQPTLHIVLTGSPGTGKTTVARIIAKMLQCTWGEEVDFKTLRLTDLKAKYTGQTAHLTRKALTPSDGYNKLVAFIDEAYQLNCKGNNKKEDSFSQEIKATLCEEAEDNRDSKCIILAGYSDEMKDLLESNPGLCSRFPNVFHCPDYNADELHQIGLLALERTGHEFESKAKEAFRSLLNDEMNGREVRTIIERIMNKAATRMQKSKIYETNDPSIDDCLAFGESMLCILEEDVLHFAHDDQDN